MLFSEFHAWLRGKSAEEVHAEAKKPCAFSVDRWAGKCAPCRCSTMIEARANLRG